MPCSSSIQFIAKWPDSAKWQKGLFYVHRTAHMCGSTQYFRGFQAYKGDS